MSTQTVMILVGAVALIGLVAILLKRGMLGGPKAQDGAPAGSAKQ